MNLRILKKLSKRALPYLRHAAGTTDYFLAEKGCNYTGMLIAAHNDMDRCPSRCDTTFLEGQVIYKPKNQTGRTLPYVSMTPASHPKKGTPMIGFMDGGEQPEWEERTVWEAFADWVHYSYIEYCPETGNVVSKPTFRTSADYFRAADALIIRAARRSHPH